MNENMKKARNAAGLSQKQVAMELRVSAPTVSAWEAGENCPSARNIKKLSELYNVTSDFLLGLNEKKEIHVTKSLDYTVGSKPQIKSPKTEAGLRTVPIVDILLPLLRNKGDGPVFPCPPSNRGGKGGGYMTARAYEGAWERYCKAVGFIENGKPTLTAHNLRHGTATMMFEPGVDELTTQQILGHSKIEITREIYTDLRNSQRKKSVAKLNRGMSKMMSTAKRSLK